MRRFIIVFFSIVLVVSFFGFNLLIQKNNETYLPLERDNIQSEHSNSESKSAYTYNVLSSNHASHDSKKHSVKDKMEPEIRESLKKMLNTSSDGLQEEVTEHGIEVKLQGRFQTVPVATINEDGQLQINDYTSVPKGQGNN